MCALEFVGPCRFKGWASVDMPEIGVLKGDPVGMENEVAWVQVAAVSRDQTRNTFTIFPSLFTEKCKRDHKIEVFKTVVYGHGAARRIEAVTSSPASLEGNRATFSLINESHHWLKNNDGHEMAAVLERNISKAKGASARVMAITNAYEEGQDSVAERTRRSWEAEQQEGRIKTGVLYDSLEAPVEARLYPPPKTNEAGELAVDEHGVPIPPSEEEVKAYLAAILTAVRGDSVWLDLDRTTASILDRRNPPSRSRRFWMNQVRGAEDAWANPAAIRAAIDPLVAGARHMAEDQLRIGWTVMRDEPIAMFFDGSKNDDSTALVGCRINDGYVFVIGVWECPPGDRGKEWLVPRDQVDARVHEAFKRFDVIGFFADPSHTKNDEDGLRYWDGYIDNWMRKYADRLKVWPTKSGLKAHAVMFDMTSPERLDLFVAAAETFIEELEQLNDIEEFEPEFKIDGHPALVAHMANARRYPTGRGISLIKEGPESKKKIDLAVAAVGARMVRRLALNSSVGDKPARTGQVWSY